MYSSSYLIVRLVELLTPKLTVMQLEPNGMSQLHEHVIKGAIYTSMHLETLDFFLLLIIHLSAAGWIQQPLCFYYEYDVL